MGLSNIPDEAMQSVRNVGQAVTRGAQRNPSGGLVGRATDGITNGLVQTASELVRLPFTTIVKPTGKFVLSSTTTVAKAAVVFTAKALASIPFLPARTERNTTAA